MKAALPPNEDARLKALHSLNVLDTPISDRFDRLTRTATRLFKAPTALVSLIDEHRQWFKSACGLDATETSRDVAFCAHAILGDDVFVVLDATKDPKFSDNPLVTGEPHVRFYAGAPLFSPDGMKLGTFCIIDYVPRDVFSGEDKTALQDLAAATMDQLIIEKSLGRNIGVVSNDNDDDVLVSMDDVYSAFVQQSPAQLIMLDNQMRILAQSNRWRQLWKSPPTDDDYLSPLRTAYPSLPERWFRELEGCIKSDTSSAGEEWVELTPGDKRSLLWEVNRWQISEGAYGVFLSVLDQTEKRHAQEKAIKSQTQLLSVYRQTPAMMHSIDASGLITEVSDYWLEKLGYKRDDVIGRPSTDFLTPASATYARDTVLPAFFRTGFCKDVMYQFMHANGDIVNIILTATAERDDHGNIVRSFAVSTNVEDLNTSYARAEKLGNSEPNKPVNLN